MAATGTAPSWKTCALRTSIMVKELADMAGVELELGD
jgi:hypothetical protein